ncbi:MAG: SAM-dependent methyltransferase [Chloroflexota bacterium]|nr:SAM-dependent methyltransferase [Chloroflexota bacterium]
MVSHDSPSDPGSETLSAHERQQRTLQRLDDGHSALLDALEGLEQSEAFLGSRWSVWEVMQHLLTESFVEALEQIASGQREMLPAFDARTDRIAADVAKLEANYQRFRRLIVGLTEEQLDLPATPYNPENNYPALSLLDLIERVSGHEGNHARQVVETRKYVAAFRSAERAVTVAGLGIGDRQGVPTATRELLSNADYVIGSQSALPVARPWIRAVELELRPDNREELVNRLVRDIRAGLWSMVVTLGDPAESAPGLIRQLEQAVGTVSTVAAPGFYRLALDLVGVSPLDAVCTSVERIGEEAGMLNANGRALIVLGSEHAGSWREAAAALATSGIDATRAVRHVANLSGQATVTTATLGDVLETEIGDAPVAVDSALVLAGA